ncbi:MAG: PHP domain-containing protein [Candidatus Poribacteria bacterium]
MNFNCDIYPKVVPVGKEAEISIRGAGGQTFLSDNINQSTFKPGHTYSIHAFSKVNLWEEMRLEVKADGDGSLRFCLPFQTQGEYLVNVYQAPEDKLITAHLFAAHPDLARRKAYKGDMHIHTYYSDGRQSPIYMAVRAEELGLDFIAITDHDKYQPSLEAIEESKKMGLNLLLLPGEEVSVREGCGHFVALCTSDWVTGQKSNAAIYDEEYQDILDNELKDKTLVDGLSKEKYAHAVWTVNKIREFGGYAVLAHPYWVAGQKFHLNRPVYDQLLEDGLYDAVEVLGDVTSEDNLLSVAKYFEEVAKGRLTKNLRKIPIMSNSDTHRSHDHTYGNYWTLVFAENLEQGDIFDAIFDLKSVACEQHPGEKLRIYGSFDLVEYALFLHREFFPLHDKIRAREGELYMRILDGKESDYQALDKLKRELNELYAKTWCSSALF